MYHLNRSTDVNYINQTTQRRGPFRFESPMIIRILYLGISNSLALAALNVLLIAIVVLTDLVNTPVIPIYPHRS